MNIENIRNEFPQLKVLVHQKPLVYFDNGATTLKPNTVINAITEYYAHQTANVHRGVHSLSEEGTHRFEETRTAIQKFINAKNSYEVIFTKGTTDSLNLLAYSFAERFLEAGDEILVSTMEHHSNIVPWQIQANRKKAIVREIPITDAGEIDLDVFKKMLSPKTKLISICHISNTLGTINPIKEMIQICHEKNIYVAIDAAQSASHMKLDVQDLDCDFLAFSAHKMYGPNGVGVLYGKESLLNEMPPYQGGGAMISEVDFKGTTYNSLPFKFEAGTPVIAEVIAFKNAIDFLNEIGLDAIFKREHELLTYAENKLAAINQSNAGENLIRIIGTAKNKASVLSFVIDGIHPHDLGTLLNQQGTAIRTGHHCTQPLMKRMQTKFTARASFSFYNTKEEIDLFINGILKAIQLLK